MEVKVMKNAEELVHTAPFRVGWLLWGTREIPETYGYLGFVPGDAFYLKMICEEEDPLCTCREDFDPVYRDSAMEAFFQFESEKEREGLPTYMNFEMNANGALLAAYGKERTYRTYFTKSEMKAFACTAKRGKGFWSVSLRLPIAVLEGVYGPLNLKAGSRFTCNFYKISEAKEIEHYAAYAPILSSVPSFHLPEYFAKASIVE